MSPNPQETADLVIFSEEILNGKLHFLCSVVEANLDSLNLFHATGHLGNPWKHQRTRGYLMFSGGIQRDQ